MAILLCMVLVPKHPVPHASFSPPTHHLLLHHDPADGASPGEIAAINNCSRILASEPYSLSGREALVAFQGLSLYTTAEACPMVRTHLTKRPTTTITTEILLSIFISRPC